MTKRDHWFTPGTHLAGDTPPASTSGVRKAAYKLRQSPRKVKNLVEHPPPTRGFHFGEIVTAATGDGTLGSFDLWCAARDCAVERVRKALEDGAEIAWELHESNDCALVYKNRRLRSQAIHAAVLMMNETDEEKLYASRQVIELLLDFKAAVDARGKIPTSDALRVVFPIHLAVSSGHIETIKLLLDRKAKVDQDTLIDDTKHYRPIHDAVWFNRVPAVGLLIDRKAKMDDRNFEGNTALHFAAELGYSGIVGLLLQKGGHNESQHLLSIRNCKGKTPLEAAVEKGQFPLHDLHLFTDYIPSERKVDAFVKVARDCPVAAAALLSDKRADTAPPASGTCPLSPGAMLRENACGSSDSINSTGAIDSGWKGVLQKGVETKRIDAGTLAGLIKDSPPAAAMLFDALTDTPAEMVHQQHPLPIRANLPLGYDACRMTCAYQEESDWRCGHQDGEPLPWHRQFAPKDPKNGIEVEIKVVKIRNLASCSIMHSLAKTTESALCSKLVVRALLKFVWGAFRPLYLVDIAHQVAVLAVITYWIFADIPSEEHDAQREVLRTALWSVVASSGILEIVLFLITAWRSRACLPRELALLWLSRSWVRTLFGVLTLALSVSTFPRLGPHSDSDMILATNGLVHWVLLLYRMRVFQWAGRRLLPILASIVPITGMIVIMAFLFFGFLQAFWATERQGADHQFFLSIFILLFTGEYFLDHGEESATSKDTILSFLSLLGVFLFLTCTINVFIAVMGDCYDIEVERVLTTFRQERAKILSTFFLRPLVPALSISWLPFPGKCLFWLGFSSAVLLLSFVVSSRASHTWFPAFFFAAWVFFLQCIILATQCENWSEKHLWVCTQKGADEVSHLGCDASSKFAEAVGRISQIKRHLDSETIPVQERLRALADYMKSKNLELDKRLHDEGQKLQDLEGHLVRLRRRHQDAAAEARQRQRHQPDQQRPQADQQARRRHVTVTSAHGSSDIYAGDGAESRRLSDVDTPAVDDAAGPEWACPPPSSTGRVASPDDPPASTRRQAPGDDCQQEAALLAVQAGDASVVPSDSEQYQHHVLPVASPPGRWDAPSVHEGLRELAYMLETVSKRVRKQQESVTRARRIEAVSAQLKSACDHVLPDGLSPTREQASSDVSGVNPLLAASCRSRNAHGGAGDPADLYRRDAGAAATAALSASASPGGDPRHQTAATPSGLIDAGPKDGLGGSVVIEAAYEVFDVSHAPDEDEIVVPADDTSAEMVIMREYEEFDASHVADEDEIVVPADGTSAEPVIIGQDGPAGRPCPAPLGTEVTNSTPDWVREAREATAVRGAYDAFFDHADFRRGWRTPPFTQREAASAFEAASRIVARGRVEGLNIRDSGLSARQLSGSAVDWMLGPFTGSMLREEPDRFIDGLVHATFKDGRGYVEGLTREDVNDFLQRFR